MDGRGDALVQRIVSFGRFLRQRGMRVTPAETLDALQALSAVEVADPREARSALRCAFVHRHQDLPVFEAAFDAFWLGHQEAVWEREETVVVESPSSSDPAAVARDAEEDRAEAGGSVYSPLAALLRRDVAALTPEETEALERLCQLLAQRLATRLSRRLRAAPHGEQLDVRRSLRGALRTGGDVLHWRWRRRRQRPGRLIAVCDVSGSMAPYARVLLHFVRGLGRAMRGVEAFVFSTSLTRVTDALRQADANAIVAWVAAAGGTWGGGTRIGQSLAELHSRWGHLVGHRTLVLVLSDGLDTGDVELLASEMRWLQRAAAAVLWLNPLASDPAYEPLAAGMRAALPHVSALLPAGTLAHLLALEKRLVGRDAGWGD